MKYGEIQKFFGQNVCYLRKKQGLTQAKLAELLNLNDETISNIERGLASTRIKTAVNIAKALNVEIKDLFDFPHQSEDEKFKKDSLQTIKDIFDNSDEQTIKTIIKTAQNIAELKK